MTDGEKYRDIVFREYYEDIFQEEDPEFGFRLIRKHIHPKLRVLLTGCLDLVAEVFETDPFTFSRMVREPRVYANDPAALRCALYGLKPSEVKGTGFPNLPSSPGRGRHIAHFELCFLVERDGVGLELRVEREEELQLLEDVYATHREKIDAILTFVRLGVDGPVASRLLPLSGMIQAAKDADDAWLAVFEPRYPFPIAARDFMGRFEECFLALYLIYDAMLSRALGIEDHFDEQFARIDEYYLRSAPVDEDPPVF